jgi:hypothetical protein
MTINMTPKKFSESEISLIHSIWKQTGKVTYKTSKYVGKKFPTYRLYLNCVADYYGIEEDHSPDGTQGVFNTYRAMENYVNEELIDIIQCDIKVKCVDISPTFSIDSNTDMSIIYSNMGGINETQFKYTVDEKFRHIPEDQYDDYFGEDGHEYELEYHDDKCVVYVIRDAIRLVEKRFGIRLGRIGSSAVDEETMKSYE